MGQRDVYIYTNSGIENISSTGDQGGSWAHRFDQSILGSWK